MTTYGRRLRSARVAAGMTQSELAERTGVAQNYISSMERQARSNPAASVTERIGAVLNIWPRAVLLERLLECARTALEKSPDKGDHMHDLFWAVDALGEAE